MWEKMNKNIFAFYYIVDDVIYCVIPSIRRKQKRKKVLSLALNLKNKKNGKTEKGQKQKKTTETQTNKQTQQSPVYITPTTTTNKVQA